MNTGWMLAFAIVVGIPLAGILSGTFTAWLKYRYRRAALDTLKSYAASGKEPPEALIRALTPGNGHPRNPGWGAWGSGFDIEDPDAEDEPERPPRRPERAPYQFEERIERRWRRRRRGERAWRGAIFWATLALGFWLAADYVASGELNRSLTIVSYILGAVAFGAVLSAILTTAIRANDRRRD